MTQFYVTCQKYLILVTPNLRANVVAAAALVFAALVLASCASSSTSTNPLRGSYAVPTGSGANFARTIYQPADTTLGIMSASSAIQYDVVTFTADTISLLDFDDANELLYTLSTQCTTRSQNVPVTNIVANNALRTNAIYDALAPVTLSPYNTLITYPLITEITPRINDLSELNAATTVTSIVATCPVNNKPTTIFIIGVSSTSGSTFYYYVGVTEFENTYIAALNSALSTTPACSAFTAETSLTAAITASADPATPLTFANTAYQACIAALNAPGGAYADGTLGAHLTTRFSETVEEIPIALNQPPWNSPASSWLAAPFDPTTTATSGLRSRWNIDPTSITPATDPIVTKYDLLGLFIGVYDASANVFNLQASNMANNETYNIVDFFPSNPGDVALNNCKDNSFSSVSSSDFYAFSCRVDVAGEGEILFSINIVVRKAEELDHSLLYNVADYTIYSYPTSGTAATTLESGCIQREVDPLIVNTNSCNR